MRDLELLRVRVPDHVTHRRFPSETVVLNLSSERYHGLDDVASEMFEALVRLERIAPAARELAQRFAVPEATVRADMREFCEALAERGLIELVDG